MSANGGKAKRLTNYSADEYPTAFSVDNKQVLYNAVIQDAQYSGLFPTKGEPELYSVNIDNLRVMQILIVSAMCAKYNSNGNKIIFYHKKGRMIKKILIRYWI